MCWLLHVPIRHGYQVMFYLGYFVMAIPAGLFINKYGYRKGVVFGLLLYGIGSLLFIPGEYWMSFNFFLFSLFVIACGLVFWKQRLILT